MKYMGVAAALAATVGLGEVDYTPHSGYYKPISGNRWRNYKRRLANKSKLINRTKLRLKRGGNVYGHV